MTASDRSSVERAFDDHHVVVELDDHAVVRAARQIPDAIGQLRRVDLDRRHRRAFDAGGHVNRDRAVRLHIADRQVEDRMAPLRLDDPAGELHAAVALVVRVGRDEGHVAQHRIVDPGLDPCDQVLRVDGADHLVMIGGHEGHHGAPRLGLHRRRVGQGALDEAGGRQPDLKLALGHVGGRGRQHAVGTDVPRVATADDLDVPEATERRGAVGLRAVHFLTARTGRRVVHVGLEAAKHEPRPRLRCAERLPEVVARAGAGVLDGRDTGHTHRLRSRIERGRGVLGKGRRRRQQQHEREHGKTPSSYHLHRRSTANDPPFYSYLFRLFRLFRRRADQARGPEAVRRSASAPTPGPVDAVVAEDSFRATAPQPRPDEGAQRIDRRSGGPLSA